MQRRSAIDSSGLPAALLKDTPRHVKVSVLGATLLLIAASLAGIGMWGGIELTRRSETAGRHVALFDSERVLTGGDVILLRKRGGGNNHRITAHYRYAVHGRELAGATTLRREERDRYQVGSPVAVWYLATEPEASWLDGYSPRPEASWPATAVPIGCGIGAVALIAGVRRQSKLLTYGRPAMAMVTKIDKKKSDHGTYWKVHYEWTTMCGATREGKYNHSRKRQPAVGDLIPIVYDRDNAFRHSRYPMPFVRIADPP